MREPELDELEMTGKGLERGVPWQPQKGRTVPQYQMARGERVA